MKKRFKIGIVGCGAIGKSLAEMINGDFSRQAVLSGLYDLIPEKRERLAGIFGDQGLAAGDLAELISRSELVIEASGAKAVFEIAKQALSASRSIMVMSVGGIIDGLPELSALAGEKGVNIFIPSGAICGIDGVKAAARAGIKKVTLITSKPPSAFSGVAYVAQAGINLDEIKDEAVLFEGSALEATKCFPQNINVAATLSLAGIGAERTRVRIVASRRVTQNTHEIEIESEAGKIATRTQNLIHPDNPKTSYLAVLSAAACLKQILDPVKIGT